MDTDEPLLTVQELAGVLKLSADTVYRKAKAGDIPGIKIGGAWRFLRSEVIEAARPAKVDLWAAPTRNRRGRAA